MQHESQQSAFACGALLLKRLYICIEKGSSTQKACNEGCGTKDIENRRKRTKLIESTGHDLLLRTPCLEHVTLKQDPQKHSKTSPKF